jgi:DNA-binding NtrC family response regulator
MEDLPMLAEHILTMLGQSAPKKRLSRAALEMLATHNWPGNVRELMHVLQRAAILAGDRMEIGADEIRYRRRPR